MATIGITLLRFSGRLCVIVGFAIFAFLYYCLYMRLRFFKSHFNLTFLILKKKLCCFQRYIFNIIIYLVVIDNHTESSPLQTLFTILCLVSLNQQTPYSDFILHALSYSSRILKKMNTSPSLIKNNTSTEKLIGIYFILEK